MKKKRWLTRDSLEYDGKYCLWSSTMPPRRIAEVGLGFWVRDNPKCNHLETTDARGRGLIEDYIKAGIFPKVGYGKCVELRAI